MQSVTPPVENIIWVALDGKAEAKLKATFAAPLVYYDSALHFEENSTLFRTPAYNRWAIG
jgi:hypothetical protein